MDYISTRGRLAPQRFCDILLMGLAPDGGLVMPTHYPRVDRDTLAAWRGLSYPDLAFEIVRLFADDIPADDLRDIVTRTYRAEVFGTAEITPLARLADGLFVQQLSNGPTLAFKDMAMQLLGNLFEYVLVKRGQQLNILGATSGDTGSAAEHAMRGRANIRVFMLSPHGKMSAFQRAQMFSLADENIHNLAIEGMFDDCQDIVKAVSNDADFKARHAIGTVNSINWARVVAQVVYYFYGYFAASDSNDQKVSFCVPSGNFGNVCAGHIARQMGLPIDRLIVATNENDVLDEFFRTGRYRPRAGAETQVTSSPSMDISKASNFERFIFDLVGRNPVALNELWRGVDKGVGFDLSSLEDDTLFAEVSRRYGFVSGRSTHADRLATIRQVAAEEPARLLDPHTADGVKVARELRRPGEIVVCLETALPAKFAETMREALDQDPPRPAGFDGLEALPQRFTVLPADVAAVKQVIEANT
ncbi:MAG: threonine synthase [Paludibacterium sp.]|uniref:threonine synthase n=1 Tax=Paludibacterium sp. TaxID=1917523 RepID=UPI0025D2FA5B|nr:threonine synthase [Paludibacterium sp.]MBV8045510.1 threonine synthase [Paludibacterium sp.]MBV8645858.1 threonine synthase [Paludibacterium sp.]